jgi:hypothetical protein
MHQYHESHFCCVLQVVVLSFYINDRTTRLHELLTNTVGEINLKYLRCSDFYILLT